MKADFIHATNFSDVLIQDPSFYNSTSIAPNTNEFRAKGSTESLSSRAKNDLHTRKPTCSPSQDGDKLTSFKLARHTYSKSGRPRKQPLTTSSSAATQTAGKRRRDEEDDAGSTTTTKTTSKRRRQELSSSRPRQRKSRAVWPVAEIVAEGPNPHEGAHTGEESIIISWQVALYQDPFLEMCTLDCQLAKQESLDSSYECFKRLYPRPPISSLDLDEVGLCKCIRK